MLKLCPAVVAILDFQSTANKNRQYLTQTFDPRPRPLNCHREKKEDCNCVANTRCWKLSFARSVAFSINNLIPHQTVTDFKQWILTTFLYSKKVLFSVMVAILNRGWAQCSLKWDNRGIVPIRDVVSVVFYLQESQHVPDEVLLQLASCPKDELHICFVPV